MIETERRYTPLDVHTLVQQLEGGHLQVGSSENSSHDIEHDRPE